MYKPGWFLEEIRKVQEEVKKWPKWKSEEIEKSRKLQRQTLSKQSKHGAGRSK